MFKKSILLGAVSALVLLAGCAATTGSKSQLKEEVRETVGHTNENWGERKADFISMSETRINDINNDIFNMEKSNNNLKKPNREKASEKVADTKDLLKSVREELAGLRSVDADDWQEEKISFLNEMNELEAKFSEARTFYR